MKFVILALATWRLASLVVSEQGPFGIFARFRKLVGVRYTPIEQEPFGINWFAKGVCCLWCVTVWFGIALAIGYYFWKPTVWIALPFALSASAIIVEGLVDGAS